MVDRRINFDPRKYAFGHAFGIHANAATDALCVLVFKGKRQEINEFERNDEGKGRKRRKIRCATFSTKHREAKAKHRHVIKVEL